jgi:hypothetical protein
MEQFEQILRQAHWNRSTGAIDADINQLRNIGKGQLPEDYLQFLRVTDGADGDLSNDPYYAIIYPCSEVIQIEKEGTFKEYFSELFVFGGTGGGVALAIDQRPNKNQKIVSFDMTNIELDESVLIVADNFTAFSNLFVSE